MSTTAIPSQRRDHRRQRREGRPEARGGHHPRLGRRPREGVLRGARLAARRRLHHGRRPRGPVHAARLPVLGSLRHEPHLRRAGIRPELLADRLRHPGCARRAGGARRRGERGVPLRRLRTALDPNGTAERPRAGPAAATGRSRRSATRTATAGCCRRSRRGCPAGSTRARPRSPPRATWPSALPARGGRPRRAREAHRASGTRTGPSGTPRTWSRSRPATELPT